MLKRNKQKPEADVAESASTLNMVIGNHNTTTTSSEIKPPVNTSRMSVLNAIGVLVFALLAVVVSMPSFYVGRTSHDLALPSRPMLESKKVLSSKATTGTFSSPKILDDKINISNLASASPMVQPEKTATATTSTVGRSNVVGDENKTCGVTSSSRKQDSSSSNERKDDGGINCSLSLDKFILYFIWKTIKGLIFVIMMAFKTAWNLFWASPIAACLAGVIVYAFYFFKNLGRTQSDENITTAACSGTPRRPLPELDRDLFSPSGGSKAAEH